MGIVIWIVVFAILGMGCYYFDRNHLSYYRRWYNFWNKEKLSEEKGFFYGQTVRFWFVMGLFIALSKAILFALLGIQGFFMELLYVPVEAGGICAGIFLLTWMNSKSETSIQQRDLREGPDPISDPNDSSDSDGSAEKRATGREGLEKRGRIG